MVVMEMTRRATPAATALHTFSKFQSAVVRAVIRPNNLHPTGQEDGENPDPPRTRYLQTQYDPNRKKQNIDIGHDVQDALHEDKLPDVRAKAAYQGRDSRTFC